MNLGYHHCWNGSHSFGIGRISWRACHFVVHRHCHSVCQPYYHPGDILGLGGWRVNGTHPTRREKLSYWMKYLPRNLARRIELWRKGKRLQGTKRRQHRIANSLNLYWRPVVHHCCYHLCCLVNASMQMRCSHRCCNVHRSLCLSLRIGTSLRIHCSLGQPGIVSVRLWASMRIGAIRSCSHQNCGWLGLVPGLSGYIRWFSHRRESLSAELVSPLTHRVPRN